MTCNTITSFCAASRLSLSYHCFSQVAPASINHQDVKFYVTPVGYDKTTSVIPCAPFLMKALPEDDDGKKKALLVTMTDTKALTFTDASLGCKTVCQSVRQSTQNHLNRRNKTAPGKLRHARTCSSDSRWPQV